MTIKQLLEMQIGEENRTGGFELRVRTKRRYRDVNGRKVQEAVLEDVTGSNTSKITADILLPKTGSVIQRSPVMNGNILRIVVCWLQPGKDGSKELYIEQYTIKTKTGDPGNDPSYQRPWHFQPNKNVSDENEINIPGMCATHIIEGYINGYTAFHGEIPKCTKENMDIINKWVAFNMDGRLAGE